LIEWLKAQPNVYLIGPVHATKLTSYLREYEVFLLCYTAEHNKEELANPHKILEYLSTGKVVVSSYIDEYKNKEELLEMANHRSELPDIFNRVIRNLAFYNGANKSTTRIQFARENTYSKKLDTIAGYIAKL
jgi:hypothetical protein